MLPKHTLSNQEILTLLDKQEVLENELKDNEEKLEELRKTIASLQEQVIREKQTLAILNTVKYITEENTGELGPDVAISSLGFSPDKFETLRTTTHEVSRYGCIFPDSSTNKWACKLKDHSNRLFEFDYVSDDPRDAVEILVLDWILDGKLPVNEEAQNLPVTA